MSVSQTLGCCVMPKKKKLGNTLLSDINIRMASLFCERLPIANKFNKLKSLLNTNNKKKNKKKSTGHIIKRLTDYREISLHKVQGQRLRLNGLYSTFSP